jgi:hypothetical protein
VVCAALPLGATAFVLAQRYKLLEAETRPARSSPPSPRC